MKTHVLNDQQEDGGFKVYLTFGDKSPIDANDNDCFECNSVEDAFKLKDMIKRNITGIYKYSSLELDTGVIVEGYYYLENGYYMENGKPDLNIPVQRHYIVDSDGNHREIAEQLLEIILI